MKSLIKSLLLITLVFAVLTVTACEKDNDGMNDFYEAGLRFSLPEDMRQLSVDYANVAYGNNEGVEFLIYYYSRDELLSMLYLDKDATVEEYEDDFIRYNEYQNVEKNYDVEKIR